MSRVLSPLTIGLVELWFAHLHLGAGIAELRHEVEHLVDSATELFRPPLGGFPLGEFAPLLGLPVRVNGEI